MLTFGAKVICYKKSGGEGQWWLAVLDVDRSQVALEDWKCKDG